MRVELICAMSASIKVLLKEMSGTMLSPNIFQILLLIIVQYVSKCLVQMLHTGCTKKDFIKLLNDCIVVHPDC